MPSYSDTAERAFRKMLETLAENVPPQVVSRLESLMGKGKIHEPERVQEVLHSYLAESESSNREG